MLGDGVEVATLSAVGPLDPPELVGDVLDNLLAVLRVQPEKAPIDRRDTQEVVSVCVDELDDPLCLWQFAGLGADDQLDGHAVRLLK